MDGLPSDDFRRGLPRFQGDNFATNLAQVDRFGELARAKSCTAAQLALAWVLAQGNDVVPIPGTKRRTYLEDNVAATELRLTPGDLAEIESVIPKGSAAGARYPPPNLAEVNR